jgi:putative NIF3 family GTP cyclohydrolase 1 type 2
MCSFNAEGQGTFRGSDDSNPFVGKKGELHTERELRVETIYPRHMEKKIVRALIEAHPYEEVAYDLYALENVWDRAGAGAIGTLPDAMDGPAFLAHLQTTFRCQTIRHTRLPDKPLKQVALCGGSGSVLLSAAISAGADVFVSGDFKYHQFFDADGNILVADIGHYESEQFTKEIIYENLTKKFPTFAFHLSQVNTNPVNYF